MTGIYAIHNIINDKYYIGQAKDIDYRWMRHRSDLKCGTHSNNHLLAAYNKYGKDAFEYLVIEECKEEDLDNKEQFYIVKFDSYNKGYNQDFGGAGCKGYKHTDEELLKVSRPVLQLDKMLNIVASYCSTGQAARALNCSQTSIRYICQRKNHQKSILGYIFVYKDEYDAEIIDWNYYLNNNEKKNKIIQKFNENGEFICEYQSISQTQKENHIDYKTLMKCLNGEKKSYKGYIYKLVI